MIPDWPLFEEAPMPEEPALTPERIRFLAEHGQLFMGDVGRLLAELLERVGGLEEE